jgi:copper(I)-binding protein
VPERIWQVLLVAVVGTAGCQSPPGGGAALDRIVVSRAAVSAPPAGAPAPAFLHVANRGALADTLLGVTSPEADSVVLHTMAGGQMQAVPALPVAAGETVRLGPGSYHLMLEGLHRPLGVGDSVTLLLRFAMAGEMRLRVPVLRYSDAVGD